MEIITKKLIPDQHPANIFRQDRAFLIEQFSASLIEMARQYDLLFTTKEITEHDLVNKIEISFEIGHPVKFRITGNVNLSWQK